MKFFQKKDKGKWVFVTNLTAYSYDAKNNRYGEFVSLNLYQHSLTLERKADDVRLWPASPDAIVLSAAVKAWVHGGPLPVSMGFYHDPSPPPKPRKPIPEKAPQKQKKVKSEQTNVVPFKAVAS